MDRPTVLLVEDEPSVRELVADVLRDDGYDVIEAQDAQEAVRALDAAALPAGRVSLILIEMLLPGMGGLGVLGYAGARVGCPPIVAMSTSPKLLEAAVRAGARAVLYKPFDLRELRGAVSGHCGVSVHAPAV
jgi:CheY-like chemotaxis protein